MLTARAPRPTPDAAAAKVKGTLVITLMRFLRAHGVDPETILARLPEPDRVALREILLPTAWYSAEMFARFVEMVTTVVKQWPRVECLLEMGRFSAQTNLGPGGVRRAYIRENDPHHVLAAISRIYRTVYSLGERSYERAGEKSALVRGHGTRVAHDHCTWVAGWLQRVVELSGGIDVRVVEARCEGTGAPCCEYRIDWS